MHNITDADNSNGIVIPSVVEGSAFNRGSDTVKRNVCAFGGFGISGAMKDNLAIDTYFCSSNPETPTYRLIIYGSAMESWRCKDFHRGDYS